MRHRLRHAELAAVDGAVAGGGCGEEGGCFPPKCNQINARDDGEDFLKKSHTFWSPVRTHRHICR